MKWNEMKSIGITSHYEILVSDNKIHNSLQENNS